MFFFPGTDFISQAPCTLVIFCCSLIPKDNSYSQQNTILSTPLPHSSSINNTKTSLIAQKLPKQEKTPPLTSSNLKNHTGETIAPKKQTAKHDNSSSSYPSTEEGITKEAMPTKEVILTKNSSSNNTILTKQVNVNLPVLKKVFAKEKLPLNNTSGYHSIHKRDAQQIDHNLSRMDLVDLQLFPFEGSFTPKYATELQRPVHKSVFQFYEVEFFRNVFIQKNIRSGLPGIADYKEESEQPLSSYTTGINTVRQKKHLIYGAGVQFNKYTERVSYDVEKESTSYTTRVDTNYRIVNSQFSSNGVPVLLIEEVLIENRIPTTVIINDQLITTNSIKRIRVPVFAGYNLSFKNWSTEVRTAVVPSILFQSQGLTVRRDQTQIESLNTETTERLSVSINNQFRLGYAINESFAIGTAIYIENDLRSYSKEVDSKLNHQGVGLWFTIKP